MILKLESVLKDLAQDRSNLDNLRQRGMAYARDFSRTTQKLVSMTEICSGLWAVVQNPRSSLPAVSASVR